MYILLLFFIVFNFIIYHKVFRVIYFDLAKGLSREIFWCILLSPFEAAIVVAVGPYVLVVLGVILAVVLIVKYVNKKKDIDENVSANNNNWQNTKADNSATDSEQLTYSLGKEFADKKMETGRVDHYSNGKNTSHGRTFSEKDTMNQMENVPENIVERTTAADGQKQENIKGEYRQDDRIFCPYCGEKILRAAKFCNFCGQTNSYGK